VQFSQNRTQRILRSKKGKQKWQGMQVLSMIESRAPHFFGQVFFWDSKREKNLPISPSIQDNPRKATLAKQRVDDSDGICWMWVAHSKWV